MSIQPSIPAADQPNPAMQLLNAKEVASILGVSKVTVYRWMREREFPLPLAISESCVRWRRDEVEAWINALPRSTLVQIEP